MMATVPRGERAEADNGAYMSFRNKTGKGAMAVGTEGLFHSPVCQRETAPTIVWNGFCRNRGWASGTRLALDPLLVLLCTV